MYGNINKKSVYIKNNKLLRNKFDPGDERSMMH